VRSRIQVPRGTRAILRALRGLAHSFSGSDSGSGSTITAGDHLAGALRLLEGLVGPTCTSKTTVVPAGADTNVPL